jgi:hypothetical protein
MRDIDVVTKAMQDAHQVLSEYIEPGPRCAEATLQHMLRILDRDDVIAARERLSKGYGQLRLV